MKLNHRSIATSGLVVVGTLAAMALPSMAAPQRGPVRERHAVVQVRRDRNDRRDHRSDDRSFVFGGFGFGGGFRHDGDSRHDGGFRHENRCR